MLKLTPADYPRVSALFEPIQHSLAVRAVIAGNNPGQIFVDNVQKPHVALATTPEGTLLAGDPCDLRLQDDLRQFLRDVVFTGQLRFIDFGMALAVHPESWAALLPDLIPTHEVEALPRYHYLCRELRYDWRAHLPAGYAVRQVDRAFWDDPAVVMSDGMREWFNVEENWGTVDNFLTHGVGFCVMQEHEVIARCLSDCHAGDQIDVGIRTEPAHRRRGLATIATAVTVEHCLQRGYRQIGWHCNDVNIGSWKTAEKVGFERAEEYTYYYYVLDPVDHLAERGWYFYQRGDYARTVAYYEQAFAQRAEHPDYYYHLAALAWARLGDADQALVYLTKAVDSGWSHQEFTQQNDAFSLLHDHPGWSALLARMAELAR